MISVKTPTGLYTISAKTAPADAAVGDEVSLWLNEGNMVIDHHGKEKNMKGTHRLIFGKLIYTGRTKNQIKFSTPEGEKVFPLERLDVKTKSIAEGSQIVVELNEAGTVIDLWKAQRASLTIAFAGNRGHRRTCDGACLDFSEADLPVRRRPVRAVFLSGDERLGIGFYQAFQARDSGVKLSRCQ